MAVSRKERREKLKRKETTLKPREKEEKENVIGECLGVFYWPSDLHLSGEIYTDERREEDQISWQALPPNVGWKLHAPTTVSGSMQSSSSHLFKLTSPSPTHGPNLRRKEAIVFTIRRAYLNLAHYFRSSLSGPCVPHLATTHSQNLVCVRACVDYQSYLSCFVRPR